MQVIKTTPVGSGASADRHGSARSLSVPPDEGETATAKGFTQSDDALVPFGQSQPADLFSRFGLYREAEAGQPGTVALVPPVSFDAMGEVFSASCILPQCASAVASAIEAQGFDLAPVMKVDEETSEEVRNEIFRERRRLRRFFRHATHPHAWEEATSRSRVDLETFGWRGLQVMRLPPPGWEGAPSGDPADHDPLGEIAGLEHIEVNTLRYCEASEPILTTEWMYDEEDPETEDAIIQPTYVPRKVWRRFRLIAHARTGGFGTRVAAGQGRLLGGEVVYFREFGDPRIIDARTGQVIGNYVTGEFPDPNEIDEHGQPKHPTKFWANEIIVDGLYHATWAPYFRPWWMGVADTDMGLTSAAEANRYGITDPTIPRVLITSEGQETGVGDLERVLETAEHERSDAQAHFRMMLVETKPNTIGDAEMGDAKAVRPQLQVHQIDVLPDDGLFVEFDEQGRKKIRSARRLSNQSVGLSEDDSYASAQASMLVEDQGVIAPERRRFDALLNATVMTSLRAKWHKYATKRRRVVSPEDRNKAVEQAEIGGGLTPNRHREMLSETLGEEIPPITEPWGDQPFELTKQQAQALAGFGIDGNDEGNTDDATEGTGAKKRIDPEQLVRSLKGLRRVLTND